MAINDLATLGPSFGENDIYIADKCNEVLSSAKLGTSYDAPREDTLLGGSNTFTLKDYECFQIV